MNAEIITIDSDDDEHDQNQQIKPCTATVSIMNERPLDINAPFIIPPSAFKDQVANSIPFGRLVFRNHISSKQVQKTSRVNGNLHVQVSQLADIYFEATLPKAYKNNGDDEFQGQFECTYNKCRKRLRNNVIFMNHLWAHIFYQNVHVVEPQNNLEIVAAQSTTKSDTSISDVDRLSMCPECLVMMKSPHEMHLHYHHIHKAKKSLQLLDKMVCYTCETLCKIDGIIEHRKKHKDNAMPYCCRKCHYRVSYRKAYINHFVECHAGSSWLLCPFCAKHFYVPPSDRQRNVVTVKLYVEHIMSHTQVVSKEKSETNGQLKELKDISDRWKIFKRKVNDLCEPMSKLINSSCALPYCMECMCVLESNREQRRHFGEMRACTQLNCGFQTNCIQSMRRHSIFSECNSRNEFRFPFGVPANLTFAKKNINRRIMFQCTGCKLLSCDGDAICRHVTQTKKINYGHTVLEDKDEDCHNSGVLLLKMELADLTLDPNCMNKDDAALHSEVIGHFKSERMLNANFLKKSDKFLPLTDIKMTLKNDVEEEELSGTASNSVLSDQQIDEVLSNLVPVNKIPMIKANNIAHYFTQPFFVDLEKAVQLHDQFININKFDGIYPASFRIPWKK